MFSFKKLICLFVIFGLVVAGFASDSPSAPSSSGSPSDVPSSSGPSDGPSSTEDHTEREFQYQVEGTQIQVEVKLHDGSSESQMNHEIDANENGIEFRVEFQKEAGNTETELKMRLRLFELIEYVPDATPGYQNETIVNTYDNWQWGNGFVDTTPSSNQKVITLSTADGIFTFTLRVNVPANSTLQFNPEDVKFDIELDTDLLRAAGWLNGTEVALKAALSSKLETEKEHEDDSNQEQNAVNVGAPTDLTGLYLSWVNYLECSGSNKVDVISSSMQVDDSLRDGDDDADSTIRVVAFAFINLNSNSNGACIWDPVVGVDRPTMASSAASLIASLGVAVFAALFALF